MSVEDRNIVDLIGVEKRTGKVILTIADHLDWQNEQNHLSALQAKINRYIEFVESGEVLVAFPKAKGRPLVIEIVAKHSFPESADDFLSMIEERLKRLDIGLQHKRLET